YEPMSASFLRTPFSATETARPLGSPLCLMKSPTAKRAAQSSLALVGCSASILSASCNSSVGLVVVFSFDISIPFQLEDVVQMVEHSHVRLCRSICLTQGISVGRCFESRPACSQPWRSVLMSRMPPMRPLVFAACRIDPSADRQLPSCPSRHVRVRLQSQ